MNFMVSSTNATLFNLIFVSAALTHPINLTLRNIFTFFRFILQCFQGSAFKKWTACTIMIYIYYIHQSTILYCHNIKHLKLILIADSKSRHATFTAHHNFALCVLNYEEKEQFIFFNFIFP